MSKIKYSILFIIIATLAGYSMSFFSSSKEGIGMRRYITTVRGMGMGGTGLGLPDSTSLNAYNIASWRYIRDTKITILTRYSITQTELSDQNFTTKTGNFSGLQLAVPFHKNQWVFGISLTPYTLTDFSFDQKYQTPTADYTETTYYEGNLARAQVNLVWSPVPSLGIAGSFNYYFGTLKDRYELGFDDQALYNSNYEMEYEFHGPGAGISFDLNPIKDLNIGGFFDLKPSLNFTRVTKSPLTGITEETEADGTLPIFWGIGSSYRFAPQWTVSADYAYQYWSKGFGIRKVNVNNLENWYRFGVGIEHAHRPQARKLLNKIDLRTGFSTGSLGYKFDNNPVKEYSGHMGVGIPFFQDRARVDVSFQAGLRGDRSRNLAQEKFYRFLFSISAGELWFQKLR